MMKAMTLITFMTYPNYSSELYAFLWSPPQTLGGAASTSPSMLTGRAAEPLFHRSAQKCLNFNDMPQLPWIAMMKMKRRNTSPQHPWMMKCGLKNQFQKGIYVSIHPKEDQKLTTPLGQLPSHGNMSLSGLQPTHKNTSLSRQWTSHWNTSLSWWLPTHKNTSPRRQQLNQRNQPQKQSLRMKF